MHVARCVVPGGGVGFVVPGSRLKVWWTPLLLSI